MRQLFFGTGAVVVWCLMSAAFTFFATWTWFLVFQVGGLRGTALATVFTSSAITTSGFALLLSHQTIVPSWVVGAMVTAAWWPTVLASAVLCDLYAADRNGHRSFTTRLYLWYLRHREEKRDGKQPTA
jgi:hypothetical protein